MTASAIRMFEHNTWANRRLIDVCGELTDEQLDSGAEGTYGSIRDTLVHIIDAEESYLVRLTGERAEPPVEEGYWPGFDLLRNRARSNGERFERVVADRPSDEVVRWTTREGEDESMPVGLFLVQAIHHGNEHRSQVATVLTHIGLEPPELSGWLYALETGALTSPDA